MKAYFHFSHSMSMETFVALATKARATAKKNKHNFCRGKCYEHFCNSILHLSVKRLVSSLTDSVLASNTVFWAAPHDVRDPMSGRQSINSVSFMLLISASLTVVKASDTRRMLAHVHDTGIL